MADLTGDELERYARHVVLDDVGPEGQAAIRDASVLVVGAGGLGAPVIQYLAAAGVGRLTVVDDEAVERSNLQRQVIHGEADVGRSKVASAADAVRALNADVDVDARETMFDADAAPALVEAHDLVVAAVDHLATRYLLNDACVLADTPFVYGAVDRLEGQVGTVPAGGPCYRCLFPDPPADEAVPDCETVGVLGPVPGIVGAALATEALKWLTGAGDALAGRLLVVDAAVMTTDIVEVARDPTCPSCGTDPAIDTRDLLGEADPSSVED